jgi:hypothetical protein
MLGEAQALADRQQLLELQAQQHREEAQAMFGNQLPPLPPGVLATRLDPLTSRRAALGVLGIQELQVSSFGLGVGSENIVSVRNSTLLRMSDFVRRLVDGDCSGRPVTRSISCVHSHSLC